MATTAQATLDGDTLRVLGDLDFDSVATLLETTKALFADTVPSRIDLGGVGRSNSAGVALLVHWLSQARLHERDLVFVDVSEQMRAIIQVVDLETVLPIV